jgi:hypothetical protein
MTQDITGGVIIFQSINTVVEKVEKKIQKIGMISLVA